MIDLEFLTTDPDEISFATRYWSIEANGKFTHTVTSLLPWRSAITPNQLGPLLRPIVVAKDRKQSCPSCEQLEVLTSRSQYRPRAVVRSSTCSRCRTAAEESRRAARKVAESALERQLDALTEQKLALKIDFEAVSDETALLILALDKAISPRLASSTFTERDCRFMTPGGGRDCIEKLLTQNAIIVRPDISPAGTFESDNGRLAYYPSKAVYQMTTPSSARSRAEAITQLSARVLGPSMAISELWLDHVSSECQRYMEDQCELHNLPLDAELKLQATSAIRVAARVYSVAELWNVLWKVVRDAASLSQRDYYNPAKAAATLPGKIKRLIEREKKGEIVLKPWTRPDQQPTGTLGELYEELFGIDENTSGLVAMDILSSPVDCTASGDSSSMDEKDRPHADRLLLAATGHGVALEVLAAYSDARARGCSPSEAISHVYDAHPFLNDTY